MEVAATLSHSVGARGVQDAETGRAGVAVGETVILLHPLFL